MTTAKLSAGPREHDARDNGKTQTSVRRSTTNAHEKLSDVAPQPDLWKVIAAESAIPLGLASAATVATYVTKHERVAMTAWIAVAVVGSAAVISAASASRRRLTAVDHSDQ